MKNRKKALMLFISILLLEVTSINVFGFLGFGNTASWKEEVLLHDGSKIIVKRWQKHGGSHDPGQEPGIAEQTITFALPGTKKVITWKDEYSKEVGHSNFALIALHILNTTPYIITTPIYCTSYNKWGRPNPPYVIFKYEKKEWKRIELSEMPLVFENINLVINSDSHEKKLVNSEVTSLEKVKQLNSSLKAAKFRTILRTPIKIWCDELIYDGKRWYGFSELDKQPSYEACLAICNNSGIKPEHCPCKKIFNEKLKGEK